MEPTRYSTGNKEEDGKNGDGDSLGKDKGRQTRRARKKVK